jgi:hypothetical protein
MLLYVAIVLGILWLLGLILNIAGGLIHLLIVIALVVFIVDIITKRHK